MSLPIYQRVAVTDAGDVIPGAEYTVINENTGVAQPIYSDRTGLTLLTPPYFADSVGTIQFFIAQGTTFRVAASGGVGTYTDRYVYGVAEAVLVQADGSASINRLSTDGVLLDLKKDGATVGSIGTKSGNINIGGGDTGLYIDPANDAIRPWSISGNDIRDNAISFGTSSSRFKDLYLSGGVYLGGTGAANKLDDYEEGTWTPTVISGTLTLGNLNSRKYTKIGNLVTVQGFINLNDNGSSSVGVILGGLPFAVIANGYCTGVLTHSSGTDVASTMYIRTESSSNYIEIYRGASIPVTQTEVDGGWIIFSISYHTNA